MTADTSHVLSAIDSALHDWQTSTDAMRWAPARLPRLNGDQKAIARRLCAQTGVDGYAATFMVLDATERHGESPHWDEVSAAGRAFVQEAWQPLGAQYQAMFRAITEAWKPVFAQMAAALQGLSRTFSSIHLSPGVNVTCWDCAGNWRRARCATCHPLAFPGPILGRKPSARRARRKRDRR